ncbi:sigma-70 family RNA polymerase sigma factor [Ochrovirga pacifica]|uniref:sigma-70 family RNA polymerase sigma factor n=1 Tax=Ochrovirga pacifica TaxID=1042376 RepID=UPI0002559FD8|nr:sigma-70 family RNA polymerase sigma factor [Ochrovirga pacifica]
MSPLEKTFKNHYKEFCLLSFHYTQDMSEAEDVVQDVFVKVLEKSEDITQLKHYLMVAVKNASLKRITNKYACVELKEQSLTEGSLFSETDKEHAFKRKVQLYKQIDLLPTQCRKIFLMCVLEGYKYQEVADRLGISVNTVKTQMKKAYKILRIALKSLYLLIITAA